MSAAAAIPCIQKVARLDRCGADINQFAGRDQIAKQGEDEEICVFHGSRGHRSGGRRYGCWIFAATGADEPAVIIPQGHPRAVPRIRLRRRQWLRPRTRSAAFPFLRDTRSGP